MLIDEWIRMRALRRAKVRSLTRNPFFWVYALPIAFGNTLLGRNDQKETGYLNSVHKPMTNQSFLIIAIVALMIGIGMVFH